jgi:Histidinol-phosphate/aromatic aminotransferase and cobyric acid decarboxylase
MRQNILGGLAQNTAGNATANADNTDRYAHGGNIRKLAERAGKRPEDILDFSASINPLGPPAWLAEEVAQGLAEVVHYPDPEAADLTLAACERYKVWPNQALAGSGVSELLPAVCALAVRMGLSRAIIPVPAYVDVDRCCRLAGLKVDTLVCTAQNGFAPDLDGWPPCCRLAGRHWSCLPARTTPPGCAFPPATAATWAAPFRAACLWWTRALATLCRVWRTRAPRA